MAIITNISFTATITITTIIMIIIIIIVIISSIMVIIIIIIIICIIVVPGHQGRAPLWVLVLLSVFLIITIILIIKQYCQYYYHCLTNTITNKTIMLKKYCQYYYHCCWNRNPQYLSSSLFLCFNVGIQPRNILHTLSFRLFQHLNNNPHYFASSLASVCERPVRPVCKRWT